jgi:hypothetical protein
MNHRITNRGGIKMFDKYPTDKYGAHGKGHHLYTILTKDDTRKRGEYAEELDIRANSPNEAKKLAQKILDAYYDKGLRISKVEMLY